eukprot:Pgem_evm1s5990
MCDKAESRNKETGDLAKSFKSKGKWSTTALTIYFTIISIVSFLGVNDALSDKQKDAFLIAAGIGALVGSALMQIQKSQRYGEKDLLNSIMANLFFSQKNDLEALLYMPAEARGNAHSVIIRQQKTSSVIESIAY